MFQPVTRHPRMYEDVARQIEAAILADHHRPGEQLPSERELIERFGVSRAVIRESLKVLAEKGLVEIKPGKGAFIRAPESAAAQSALGLYLRRQRDEGFSQNLVEVRQLLEEETAGLAAKRATAEDLEKLEAALAEMAAGKDNIERFARADMRFHQVLAEATHNDLFVMLLRPITDLLLELMEQLSPLSEAREQALHHHRRILRHIKQKNGQQARQAMRAHLAQFARRLKEYQATSRTASRSGSPST